MWLKLVASCFTHKVRRIPAFRWWFWCPSCWGLCVGIGGNARWPAGTSAGSLAHLFAITAWKHLCEVGPCISMQKFRPRSASSRFLGCICRLKRTGNLHGCAESAITQPAFKVIVKLHHKQQLPDLCEEGDFFFQLRINQQIQSQQCRVVEHACACQVPALQMHRCQARHGRQCTIRDLLCVCTSSQLFPKG